MKLFFCLIISSFILILLYVYILQSRKKPIEGFNDWLYSMDKATTIPDSYIKTQVVAKEGNESKIHDTNSIIADLNDNIAIENNLFNIATITHGSNVTSIHDLGSTIDNLENLISTFDNEILDANMDVNTITISELDQRITKLKDLHQTLIDSLNVKLKNSIPDGWHQNLPIMQSKIERLTDIILYYENVKKTLVNDNTFLPVVPNISFEFENNWQRMNDMCKSEVGECWLRDSDNEKIYSKMSFDHIHTKPEDWPNNLSTCERNVKEMNGNQDTCIDTKNTASFLNTACDHIDSISLYEVGNTAEYTKIPNSLFNASKSGSGMNEKINCSVNHSGTLNETYFTDINVVKEKATNNCHNNGHHGEERFSCWGMDNGIDINNQSIVSAGAQIKNLNTFSKSWSDTTSSSNKHGSCLINDSCRSESELREHVNHIKEPNNWQCRTVSQSADGLTVSNNQINTYNKVYIPGTWNSTTNTRNTRTITYADDSCRSLADANAHTNCLSSGNYKCYEIDGQNNVVEKGLTVKKVYTQPTNVTDPNTIGTCNTTNPCLTFEQAQNNAQTNAQTLCTSQTIKCYNADNTTTDQNMVYANGQCSKPSTCQEERSCIYQTVYTDNSQTFNSGDIGKTNCTSSTGTQHAWLLESVHSDSANNRNDYSKWSSDLSGANNFCSRNQTEINAFNTTNKTKNSTTPCIFSCTASDYDTNISSFENEANAIAGINVNNDICSSSALCDVTYWKAKLKNTNCVGDPTSDIQQANVNCPENCVPVVTAPVVTAPAPAPAPDPVPAQLIPGNVRNLRVSSVTSTSISYSFNLPENMVNYDGYIEYKYVINRLESDEGGHRSRTVLTSHERIPNASDVGTKKIERQITNSSFSSSVYVSYILSISVRIDESDVYHNSTESDEFYYTAPVESPQDCEGSYLPWTKCSANCGGGTQTRTFDIRKHASAGGNACPTVNETQDCNTHACTIPALIPGYVRNIKVNSVTATSFTYSFNLPENMVNYNGYIEFKYVINRQQHTEGGYVSETIPNATSHERIPNASDVGTKKIEGLINTLFTFNLYDMYKLSISVRIDESDVYHNSKESDGFYNSVPVESPQDCEGSYLPWTKCSANCGGGTQTRTFDIRKHASTGGNACPTVNETQDCNTHACINVGPVIKQKPVSTTTLETTAVYDLANTLFRGRSPYLPNYPVISVLSRTTLEIEFKFAYYVMSVHWVIVPIGHPTLTAFDVAVMTNFIQGRTTLGLMIVSHTNDSELYTITSGPILKPDTGYRLEFVIKGPDRDYSPINKITFTTLK
jgi:hypothetical protein